MTDPEDKTLITPATTPGSVHDGTFFLGLRTSYKPSTKLPWYKKFHPPYALLTASILQIIFHSISDANINKLLQFEPNNQLQIWRFITYMLLHGNWFHLVLNVFIQCIFAAALEHEQGHFRVTMLYLGGGAIGAFGAACIRPDLVIGASAGVYALLLSHVSHVLLNMKTVKYKIFRCLSVLIIVASDVAYNLVHFYYKGLPIISWGAHAVGALSGLVLGLLIYRSSSGDSEKGKTQALFWLGICLLSNMLLCLIVVNYQVKKCTPNHFIRYIYLC